MISEARKSSNRRWDKANITTLCCRIRADKAAAFKEACARRGTNPNAVFLARVEEILEEDARMLEEKAENETH